MTELQLGFIADMASTLAGDGFRPYGSHRCLTTMISDCPKADFSPEKVSLASSSLRNTLSQSSMCVATNRRHPSGPIVSSLSSTGHPLIGMSSKTGVEIQAQHRPDRLKKPRTKSVGTDRIGRFYAENRDDARKDIPRGIYFGVSVGALNEH